MTHWEVTNEILRLSSKWLDLIAENLVDDKGGAVEYWRVEKDDSVVILPVYQNSLILPKPVYRHGVGKETYDFPGGRMRKGEDVFKAVNAILCRELMLNEADIQELKLLNRKPWHINSSFSNQNLYGVSVLINNEHNFDDSLKIEKFDIQDDIENLLEKLSCLQCRSVLLEWLYSKK